jgi:hypothetical protein
MAADEQCQGEQRRTDAGAAGGDDGARQIDAQFGERRRQPVGRQKRLIGGVDEFGIGKIEAARNMARANAGANFRLAAFEAPALARIDDLLRAVF